MYFSFTASLLFCSLVGLCASHSGCPDEWTPFKDEKCYILISSYSTYSGAKESCDGKGGTLALVKAEDEQLFLKHFIFNTSSVEINVWIGATRVSESQFSWDDGTSLEYSDWDVDSPSSIAGRDCVAMQSRLSKLTAEDGKWKDTSCNSAYYFVCEKAPTWSMDEVMKVLVETRKKLDNTMEKLLSTEQRLNSTATKLTDESKKVETLQKNPVPVGFIYYEHSGQPAPRTLWPSVTWTDVTSTYAGLFFRALGGNSASFGTTQEGDSPRLSQVELEFTNDWTRRVHNITPGAWSAMIYGGNGGGKGNEYGHRFKVSNPEVRPRNAAIRIWKRSA